MYRRDISFTLRLLGLVFLVLVVYQVWVKPSTHSPISPAEPTSPVDHPSDMAALGQQPHVVAQDVPPTRLIELEEAAPFREADLIRDDLERGNYKVVESALSKLPPNRVVNERAKRFAAGLWNNLGVQQEKYGGIEVSVKAFKKAVALDPKNPTILLNLTQAYWGLRDQGLTQEFLQTVIRVAPQDPFPHLALADLLLDQGNPTEAAQHLQDAEPSSQADSSLRPYAALLTAKLSRHSSPVAPTAPPPTHAPAQEPLPIVAATKEVPINSRPDPTFTSHKEVGGAHLRKARATEPMRALTPTSHEHFMIEFDGEGDAEQSAQIRSILEYGYQDMSQKFGHVPLTPIKVVLHSKGPFAGHTGHPAWADTLYQERSATIHIPMDGALEDLALLSRVIRHQLAHALLDTKDGQDAPIPAWLVEGVAIQLAEDPWPDLEDEKQHSRAIIPLSRLQDTWSQLPKDAWAAAYLESWVAVQTLVDQYNVYGIRQVLNAIRMGQPLDGAMRQKLSISYEQFLHTWETHYKATAHVGQS